VKISISGIRGIYDDDINLHDIVKYSRLFGAYIRKLGSRTCLLARDTRPSSNILFQTVCAALMEQQINVLDIDIATTPAAFRESRQYKSAIIVTASHNPIEWNGLKFAIDGRGMFENELATMLDGTISPGITYGSVSPANTSYINDIIDLINKYSYSANIVTQKNIGLDPGGGAASKYASELFTGLGQRSHSINDIDGISSRSPDPTTDPLNELCNLVTTSKLDFGFAFDLDGDRLVVVDKYGKKLTPDLTLLLCIAGTLQQGMKKYVTSLDTSNAIADIVNSHSGNINYSKVGEANVVQTMIQENAEAGGEGSSAGFILPSFNMCRDGMLSAAIIASLNDKVIDECMSIASKYEIVRTKIPIGPSHVDELMQKLKERFKEFSYDVLESDGIKALVDDNSWILVRPSNTENVLRISVESRSDNASKLYGKAKELVVSIYDQIK
jgi:phosphomannomutase